MVLAVGQFVFRKGFDVLINASARIPKDIGVFIVGGEPKKDYLELINKNGLTNVHFVSFQSKKDLSRYYKCADLFVMPTREDIWGLVVNEAMSFGLPVVSSDRCVSGLEMIKNGENGYIFKSEDVEDLSLKISSCFVNDHILQSMGEKSLMTIKEYTIEKMAEDHYRFLKDQ